VVPLELRDRGRIALTNGAEQVLRLVSGRTAR
jgi:hypothetical protein